MKLVELISDAAHRIIKEVEADPGLVRLVVVELIDLGGKHIHELIGSILPHVQLGVMSHEGQPPPFQEVS